ncbi:MAG TPA: hypothetical protein VD884_01305 [Ohtaekwangia sp.]|nr:hypothetical protein [Ohtaekwangia sp.]
MATEFTGVIKKYLDKNKKLKFKETVNRSFANEEMTQIEKREERFLLITMDNNSGTELYEYEVEDSGNVSVYDLIWIMEQIEFEEGV